MRAAGRKQLAAGLLALTLGACAGPAAQYRVTSMSATSTDGRFQIEWNTGQTKDGKPLISGYVTNTRGGGVANIRTQAQTLDAQGQVIDTGTALSPGYLAGFGRIYFEVPLEKTGPGYRVSVVSWDFAGSGQ